MNGTLTVKDKVDFVCPVCLMTIKPQQERVQIEGPREDTIYYAHASHEEERENSEDA